MASNDNRFIGEVRYTRELGVRQAVSLGLRASLATLAFLALGPLVQRSGAGAPLALILGVFMWTPTVLSYLELASNTPESGIHNQLAQYRSGILPFLAVWALFFANLLAAGQLARQASGLLAFWPSELLPPQVAPVVDLALPVLILALAFLIALRRRPWRRADDLVLAGGLVATGLTAISVFLWPGEPVATGKLAPSTLQGITSGALLPVLILIAAESIGEWKSELRRPNQTMPRISLIALVILLLGNLVLLLSGLQIDKTGFAATGLAPLLAKLQMPGAALLTRLLFAITLIAAASALLLQANRLLRGMTREGYLPRPGGQGSRIAPVSGLLVVVLLGVIMLGLPGASAFAALTGMMLILALAINITAILVRPGIGPESHQAAQFTLPFPPLVPSLALAITLFLSINAGRDALLSIAGAVAVAGLIFILYGNEASRAAQEGKTVFRLSQRGSEDVAKDRFRVLVPLLGAPAERRALIRMAGALARQQDGEVLALEVIVLPPQQTRAEGARLAKDSNQMLRWSLGQSQDGAPIIPLTRIGRELTQAIIDTAREQNCDLILLNWLPEERYDSPAFKASSVARRTRLVRELVRGAPSMVAALSGSISGSVKRILVPTAGGPHAPVAAQLALGLARVWDAQVVGLNILRDGDSEEAVAQGRAWVMSTFAGLAGADEVEVRLVPSQKPIAQALLEEAEGGAYDLVMLGASNEGLLDRVLFGDIPQQVAEVSSAPAIMVRAAQPLQEARRRLLWERVQAAMPTLDVEDQIELYRTLRRGARPTINFFVLIVLSALIATLGLWQNSAAVIIGAMLVAPLMTPMLATSLGIVLGDARMIRVALEATIKGVLAGIGIALFFTLILRQSQIGSEILGRTRPNMLDLVVALASGAAGAYALARKEVSAALPGVAIAAALMPPLCTIGIGLAIFDGSVAGGALLLFTTNLTAITIAGSLVFLLLGMRPRRGEEARTTQFRRGLMVTLALLLVISAPLAWLGMRSAEEVRNQTVVQEWLPAAVGATGTAELRDFEVRRVGDELLVHAHIFSTDDTIQDSAINAWSDLLARKARRPVRLTVDVQPVTRLVGQSGKIRK